MKTFLLGLMALLLMACSAPPPRSVPPSVPPSEPPAEPTDVPTTAPSTVLGQPFTLAFGQTATLTDAPIAITFDFVGEDSRCPSRVQCVWSGRAVLGFSARYQNAVAETLQLITKHSPEDNFKRDFHGYLITMTAVQPYPETPDNPIKQNDYRVTLTITR